MITPLSPYKCPHIRAAYDMRLETGYANNDPVGTLTDQTGHGYTLTSAGSNRPVCITNQLNGSRIVRFTGSSSHYMAAATAANWAFLHDGSGHTAIAIFRARATASSYFPIYDTGTYTGTQIGVSLAYNATAGAALGQLESNAANGLGGAVVTDALSAKNALMVGCWSILTTRFKYAAKSGRMFVASNEQTIWSNGVLAAQAAMTAAPSVSNPTSPIFINRFASPSGSAFYGDMELGGLYFFDVALDEPTLDAIGYWLDDAFGVHYAVTIGEDGYENAFGNIIRHPTTKLFHIGYRVSQQDSLSKSTLIVRDSANGRDWSPKRFIYRTDDAHFVGSFHATALSNGSVIVTTWTDLLAGGAGIPVYFKSSDGLRTWTGPTTIANHGFTLWAYCETEVIEPDPVGVPGTIYTTVYGKNTAATFTSVKFMKSTDYGVTWTLVSTMANGTADSRLYDEAGFDFLTASKIIAFIRVSTGNGQLWYTKSTDTGATWSAPVQMTIPSAYNMPRVLTLASGTKILSLRYAQNGPIYERAVIYWSTDSANDYGNVTTSWHGPFYPDPINGTVCSIRGVEVVPGQILYLIFTEPGQSSTPVGPPGAYPSLGRVLKVKESEILTV